MDFQALPHISSILRQWDNYQLEYGQIGPSYLYTRNRFLQEAERAYGCVEWPSLSSAVSICLPLCTPSANLLEAQIFLVPPGP